MTGIVPRRAVERCERLSKLGPPPPQRHNRKLRKWLDAFASIMAMDISELGEMLREVYPAKSIAEAAQQPNPMLALLSPRTMAGRLEQIIEAVRRPDDDA